MKKAGLRLAFYGDDFTGSTDALEVLALAGLRCALFLQPPTPELLARLPPLDAIGVAGDSRAMSPAEMDVALPPVFRALAVLPAPIIHYKVCSTFDSSPAIGSIGRAIEIGRREVSRRAVPVVAGTTTLARFCVFGTLFARSATDNQVYRIDRHPIMSRHPVTPMTEGDLALHLARQAPLRIAKLTCPTLDKGVEATLAEQARLLADGADAVLFDTLTENHLGTIGTVLSAHASAEPLFVVGGSGVEYALTDALRQDQVPVLPGGFAPVERLLVVSGSASALSAAQIDHAVASGFAPVAVDAAALVAHDDWRTTADRLVADTAALLNGNRSVVLHTVRGPDDPRIGAMLDALVQAGQSRDQARHEGGRTLGIRLGGIVRDILARVPLPRLILAGGDTSSQVTKALAPDALTMAARLATGAPLCRTLSFDGGGAPMEIALKGGQAGDAGLYTHALHGASA